VATFDTSLAFTLKAEGGYVDNALDRGGPTNMGITMATLSSYLGRQATTTDVQSLTVAQAGTIYAGRYWIPMRCDAVVAQANANAMFDLSVIAGVVQASKLAQGVCGATQDGVIGAKTVAAINAMLLGDFPAKLGLAACKFFGAIVVKDATQGVFLANWLHRGFRLAYQTL
jgi:lysozyme family protein